MKRIVVSLDLGSSLVKALYKVGEHGRLGAIAMDSQILPLPLESIQSYKDGAGGFNASLPEDDAWLTFKKRADNGIVLGHLAKQFKASAKLKQLKYEQATPKLMAVIGSIIQRECLDTAEVEIIASVLLPYGEFSNREQFEKEFTKESRNYYFRNQKINVDIDTLNCFPEGCGLIANLTRSRGEGWFAKRTVVVLMCGHRNISLIVFDRGAMSRASQTTDLGFIRLVESVIQKTSLIDVEAITKGVYEVGDDVSPSKDALRVLIRSQDPSNYDAEAQQLSDAIKAAKKEYWALVQDWLNSAMPDRVDELIIAGGAAQYLKKDLDNFLGWAEPSWSSSQVSEELLSLFSSFPEQDTLAMRFKDVYALYSAFHGGGGGNKSSSVSSLSTA